MLPKKIKTILLSSAVIAMTLTGCSEPVEPILTSAQSVELYANYLSKRIKDKNELSGAILKVAYANQIKEWENKKEFQDIDWKPLSFRRSVKELSNDSVVEYAEKAMKAKEFSLDENEAVFVAQYIYTMITTEGEQVFVPLSKQQKNKIKKVAKDLSKLVLSKDKINRLSLYSVLSEETIDWKKVKNITETMLPQTTSLNKRASIAIDTNKLGLLLESNLSTSKLMDFVEEHQNLFILGDEAHSLLPLVAYALVTQPYRVNSEKNKTQAMSYLDFIILKEIPRLSSQALALKKENNKNTKH